MTKRSLYGSSLKDFELGDQIGHGGFAKVFKAKCLVYGCYGEYVAIKRIEKKPQIWNKIKTEINIHSSLANHPAVVQFYTSFEDENYWYIVMELCTGGSLEKYVEHKGRLCENEAILLIKQIIEGVGFLHANHILHRDLSLRNVLLTESQNVVKIIDFGLAVKLDEKDEKINAKVGTANFMAPEVVKYDSYSYKADCWSIGCVLYALLFGSLPFNAETKKKIQKNIKHSNLKFPDNVKISSKAKEFLESLLNKNPEKRVSFPAALRNPLFRMSEISAKINKVNCQEYSGDTGMSISSKSQHIHTSNSGSDQYKSKKERKNESVKSNNIIGSHDNLFDNVRFRYQSHQVLPQKHVFDCAPYQDRNSKENKILDERNTFFKETVRPYTGRKCSQASYQNSNGHNVMSSLSKFQSTQASSNGPNEHRSMLSNSLIAGSHSNLSVNTRFGYQSHPEISQKQRFEHATHQDSYKYYTPKSNGDSGMSSSSKSNEPNRHISLRNNNNAGSHDNLVDNTRCGYQSHQEISQKQRYHIPHQDRQITENKNYTDIQNTVVKESLKDIIDPLNTARLRPQRKENKDFLISILSDGRVCLECLKCKKKKKYVYLFYLISDNGLMINVYKPKKKILLNPERAACFSRSEHEVQYFTFENLPKKEGEVCHWRNYNFAKIYVDCIRGITTKVTIYGDNAVCEMMENTPNPNYRMEFYNGRYNGFKIYEKNCKLTIKDRKDSIVTQKDLSNSILEEFEYMKQRCKMLEKNVEAYQESTFPAKLGKKPYLSKETIMLDDDKENSSLNFLQSPSDNALNSGVPVHIITTNPGYNFSTFHRNTSTSYLDVQNASTTNSISYKNITDIIPNVQDLKVENEWIIAEYNDNIQMWLSTENDSVSFKLADKQMCISIGDHPELMQRYEKDSRQILRCVINQTRK